MEKIQRKDAGEKMIYSASLRLCAFALNLLNPLISKILVIFALFLGIERFCYYATDGFAEVKIHSSLNPNPAWEPSSYPSLDPAVFNQPYYYLGKGAQCFAFLSADGRYVIKFFRHDHFAKKRGKVFRDFASYKIAFEALREETGLLYLHLNKTKNLGKSLTFFDKIGVVHRVPLDEMEFLVQQKADLALPTLRQWLAAGEVEKVKAGIGSLVELIRSRCEKGIFDKDPDLRTNFGFAGTRAMQLDAGRFRWDPAQKDPDTVRNELRRMTQGLQQWLEEDCPELSIYLEQLLVSGA